MRRRSSPTLTNQVVLFLRLLLNLSYVYFRSRHYKSNLFCSAVPLRMSTLMPKDQKYLDGSCPSLVWPHCSPGDQFALCISDSVKRGHVKVTVLMRFHSRQSLV